MHESQSETIPIYNFIRNYKLLREIIVCKCNDLIYTHQTTLLLNNKTEHRSHFESPQSTTEKGKHP